MKTCSKCTLELPDNAFTVKYKVTGGLNSICKVCICKINKEYSQIVSCPTRKYVIDVSKLTSEECKTFLKSQHEKLTRKVFANIENTQGELEE